MAKMKQIKDTNTTFLGWYGKCGEPKCENFDLTQISDSVAIVYQFSENGLGLKTFVSNNPLRLQGFTKLECGNSYWFVLKKGTSVVDIPELTLGYSNNGESLGFISDDCYGKTAKPDPTPTPTPTSDDAVCPTDVRECPNGDFISRDPKNGCRFPVCGWNPTEHKKMYDAWVYYQPVHYSYDFKYIGIRGYEDEVSVRVLFDKIVDIRKRKTNEAISVDELNESITDAEHNNKYRMRFLTPRELFSWVAFNVNKKDQERPYSVKLEYGELGHIKSAIIDKNVDNSDDEFGFEIWNLKELEYNGKCPPQKKKCADGTYVKRNPENNCRFDECGEVATPTPVETVEIPKLKFRWLVDGDNSILQVANIPNPFGDDIIADYRTVYGSRVPPKRQTNKDWPHAKLSRGYAKKYGMNHRYEDMVFIISPAYDNQLVVRLGQKSKFHPNGDTMPNASFLYLHDEDTQPEDYHGSAYTFPHIRKTNMSDDAFDFVNAEPEPCTEDAKLCADGTVVERDPYNDCNFYPCPDEVVEDVSTDDTTSGEEQSGIEDVDNSDYTDPIDDSNDSNDYDTIYEDDSSNDNEYMDAEDMDVNSDPIDGSMESHDYDTMYNNEVSVEDLDGSIEEQSSESDLENIVIDSYEEDSLDNSFGSVDSL